MKRKRRPAPLRHLLPVLIAACFAGLVVLLLMAEAAGV
jgi:hypothetical protein